MTIGEWIKKLEQFNPELVLGIVGAFKQVRELDYYEIYIMRKHATYTLDVVKKLGD